MEPSIASWSAPEGGRRHRRRRRLLHLLRPGSPRFPAPKFLSGEYNYLQVEVKTCCLNLNVFWSELSSVFIAGRIVAAKA